VCSRDVDAQRESSATPPLEGHSADRGNAGTTRAFCFPIPGLPRSASIPGNAAATVLKGRDPATADRRPQTTHCAPRFSRAGCG
jgi:hypothetical protein